MFVLIASGGQYDDKWSRPELISEDSTKLLDWANRQTAKTATWNSYVTAVRQLFVDTQIANPIPKLKDETQDWPRWASGINNKDITPFMRDERNAIKYLNEQIIIQNKKLKNNWMQSVWRPIVEQYLSSLGPEVMLDLIENPTTSDYCQLFNEYPQTKEIVNYRIIHIDKI